MRNELSTDELIAELQGRMSYDPDIVTSVVSAYVANQESNAIYRTHAEKLALALFCMASWDKEGVPYLPPWVRQAIILATNYVPDSNDLAEIKELAKGNK